MAYWCKNAIVLLGKPDSGKTTTLREVASQLLALDGAVLKNNRRCLYCLSRAGADVTVVVEISGRVVIVRSCGDDEHELVYTQKLIEDFHCDIAIFPVSMPKRDGGRKAVYGYYQENKNAIAENIKDIVKDHKEEASAIDADIDSAVKKIMETLSKLLS